jgi:pimeloyl-ACP methyl ester carboxylesterase
MKLVLHRLRGHTSVDAAAKRHPLLLLHELGSRSPASVPLEVASWPGEIWALDLSGHGESQHARAGGYSPEILMADVDAALQEIGPSTIVGYGIGAFLALLIAGSRPKAVRGAVLCDGRGLDGGGAKPGQIGNILLPDTAEDCGDADPYAVLELATDVRPPGYAQIFARQAVHLSGVKNPITISAARPYPPWLQAVADSPGVAVRDLATALSSYLDANSSDE